MPVITVRKFESRETLQNEYDSGVTEKENILFYCTPGYYILLYFIFFFDEPFLEKKI